MKFITLTELNCNFNKNKYYLDKNCKKFITLNTDFIVSIQENAYECGEEVYIDAGERIFTDKAIGSVIRINAAESNNKTTFLFVDENYIFVAESVKTITAMINQQ